MKVEAVPFYAILVAAVTGGCWFVLRYEFYRFKDPKLRQFCDPEISEGTQRLGRDVMFLHDDALQVGDIVRFRTARTGAETTSRVVAVAGQRVAIVAGRLHIDGVEVKDPWGKRANAADVVPDLFVPEGCVYVLNDMRWSNHSDRLDSRAFGPIPVRSVEYVFSPKDGGG
ncbi:MAG: signal peptidase I [Planctomycetota bacterium]|nr:signal peptidase I [Planctomycetota bacterium]